MAGSHIREVCRGCRPTASYLKSQEISCEFFYCMQEGHCEKNVETSRMTVVRASYDSYDTRITVVRASYDS